jgi:hypothetical protein
MAEGNRVFLEGRCEQAGSSCQRHEAGRLRGELVGDIPSLDESVRGAISLALYCQAGTVGQATLWALVDLERLGVGTLGQMGDSARERTSAFRIETSAPSGSSLIH